MVKKELEIEEIQGSDLDHAAQRRGSMLGQCWREGAMSMATGEQSDVLSDEGRLKIQCVTICSCTCLCMLGELTGLLQLLVGRVHVSWFML
jgi:hypothetical protein